MLPPVERFRANHDGVEIRHGTGVIADLGDFLADRGVRRALVVCGRHVGGNEELLAPIEESLGGVEVGMFTGTTPAKSITSVYEGIERMREFEPDVLIGLGGGSSLDIARQMSVFAADGRSMEEIRTSAAAGELEAPTPRADATAVVIVPTTLAGADLSYAGSIEVLSPSETPSGAPVRTEGRIKPLGVFFDPSLFASTPRPVLYGSAMNGFNKGLETIYSPVATALSDALAVQGVRLMSAGIGRFEEDIAGGLRSAVAGLVLAQMERRVSIIHAVARGVSRFTDVQQGVAHAVLAPHVVRYVFAVADARRRLLAVAFGIDPEPLSDAEVADAVVDSLIAMRDSVGLPSRLGQVLDVDAFDVGAAADYVTRLPLMEQAPLDVPASSAQVRELLEAAC